ncbi:MAG: hypothetical protein GX173_08930 [Ruminococcaceae bacterium]|nr:hypothetical protein [Oscillospiraceae bacterium]
MHHPEKRDVSPGTVGKERREHSNDDWMDQEMLARLARLARLDPAEEERRQLCQDLGRVIQSFSRLSRVDTTCIEPVIQPEGSVTQLSHRLIGAFSCCTGRLTAEQAPQLVKQQHLKSLPAARGGKDVSVSNLRLDERTQNSEKEIQAAGSQENGWFKIKRILE